MDYLMITQARSTTLLRPDPNTSLDIAQYRTEIQKCLSSELPYFPTSSSKVRQSLTGRMIDGCITPERPEHVLVKLDMQ